MEIKLYKGDCLEIMKEIKSDSVDMILADLPYGTTACSWDFIIPMELLWKEYNRIAKENAAMVFTGTQPFTAMMIRSNLKNFRYEWIWEKNQGTNPMNAHNMPLRSHENIMIFYRKKPTYNPQLWYDKPYYGFISADKTIGESYGHQKSKHRNNPAGERFPKTIIKMKQEKGLHPTQKPVKLMEYLINTYTNENDVVLDNVMGSGTTGIACKNLNRGFIGIELNEEYFNIAEKRINTKTLKDFYHEDEGT